MLEPTFATESGTARVTDAMLLPTVGQRLAQHGHFADAHAGRWRVEAEAIRACIDEHCWSADTGSYVRSAGSRELDASLCSAP